MRLSMNHIPSNLTLCTNVAIPLVAFIQPLALQKPEEETIPVQKIEYNRDFLFRRLGCGFWRGWSSEMRTLWSIRESIHVLSRRR